MDHAPSAQMTGSCITSCVIGQHSMSSTSVAASIRPLGASRPPFAGVRRPPLPGVSLRFMLTAAIKPVRHEKHYRWAALMTHGCPMLASAASLHVRFDPTCEILRHRGIHEAHNCQREVESTHPGCFSRAASVGVQRPAATAAASRRAPAAWVSGAASPPPQAFAAAAACGRAASCRHRLRPCRQAQAVVSRLHSNALLTCRGCADAQGAPA